MNVAGEELELCAERGVFWRRRKMLLVADPHFGKGAAFRSLGVPVPKGTTNGTLARLDALISRTAPEEVVFLGDFLHARSGRNTTTFDALSRWRASHAAIRMRIVRGNHDHNAGDPPAEIGIESTEGPTPEPPFALAHHPVVSELGYVLAGHLHPCALLTGAAGQRKRLPCFWFRPGVGVLPAFGDFTGQAEVRAREGDRVWVIAEHEILSVGPISPGR